MLRIGKSVLSLTTIEMLQIERRRLLERPMDGEPGFGVALMRYRVRCPGNAPEVVSRVKEVMLLVVDASLSDTWPSEAEWMRRLPHWFLLACAPTPSAQEAQLIVEAARRMSGPELRHFSRTERWDAPSWLWQMEPGDLTGNADPRYWYWWDAEILDRNTIETGIEVLDLPCPLEGFPWMYRAAGASDVDEIPP